MPPLQLAVYGADELAEPYLNLLARRADVRIRAVCDPLPRLAEQAAAAWGARVHAHYATMLREEKPDALLVAVPARALGDVLIQAAAHRIPFLVEPPGAVDWDSARRLAAQIAEARLVTTVAYSARYVDVVREAKEYLGVNATPLGRASWLTGGYPDAPSVLEVLWHEACRLIDLWRSLTGEIESVSAAVAGSEALVVSLRGINGSVGTLTITAQPVAEPRIELELFGAGWSFCFSRALSELSLYERDKTTTVRQVNHPRAEQLEAFFEAVRSQAPTHVANSYPESLANLAVAEAIRRAVEQQRWVAVAEVLPPSSPPTVETPTPESHT